MVGPWSSATRVLVIGTVTCLVVVLVACAPQIETPRPTPTESRVPGTSTAPPPTAAVPGTSTAPAPSTAVPLATPTGEPDAGGREMRLTPAPLPSLERVPVSEPPLVTGEVPTDLLEAILQDAEARTGVEAAEMDLLRAEEVIWNDGSLGCPQPGMEYTQMLVDGYWVVLRAAGKELDYRATQTGFFVLCERKLALPGGAVAPTPEQ